MIPCSLNMTNLTDLMTILSQTIMMLRNKYSIYAFWCWSSYYIFDNSFKTKLISFKPETFTNKYYLGRDKNFYLKLLVNYFKTFLTLCFVFPTFATRFNQISPLDHWFHCNRGYIDIEECIVYVHLAE